jgi:glycosyltransferase involved in cell wall biosynthesis
MRRTIPVTVLIPAYNAEQFLRSAVDTVRSQSVNVEEILVVDDASSDGTAALAERLGVRVLRASHGGPAATRNAGLAIAKSEWIATLDADDIWHARKLELQYDAVLAQPELGLVFTDFDAVSVSDGRIHKANVVSEYRSFKDVKRTRLTEASSLLDFEALELARVRPPSVKYIVMQVALCDVRIIDVRDFQLTPS